MVPELLFMFLSFLGRPISYMYLSKIFKAQCKCSSSTNVTSRISLFSMFVTPTFSEDAECFQEKEMLFQTHSLPFSPLFKYPRRLTSVDSINQNFSSCTFFLVQPIGGIR